MIESALNYASRGWPVFPLHGIVNGRCTCRDPECGQNSGKHPRINGWQQQATTDEGRIREWWDQWPDANIGIPTGLSFGLGVLDVDPRHRGDETLQNLINEHENLPETFCVQTGGGGEHYYFRLIESLGCRTGFIQGLDFKANGGYVVGHGSLHLSGNQYVLRHDGELAPLPTWLADLVRSRNQSSAQDNPGLSSRDWVSNAIMGVDDGYRGDSAARLAGHFIGMGLSDSEVTQFLLMWNQRNNPPMNPQRVHSTVHSIRRTHQRNNPLETQNYEVVSFEEVLNMPHDNSPPIIEGILYRGESLLITGPTAVGKSIMTLELALSISTGRPFLNQYQIPAARRVLLLQSEVGFRPFRDRLQRMTHDWSRERGVALRERLFVPMTNGSPTFIGTIADQQGRPGSLMVSLRRMIEQIHPDIVILDPLSSFHGAANENNNADMRYRLDLLSSLAREYRITLVIVHHHGKTMHKGVIQSRGATSITDWGSAVLTLTRPRQRGNARRHFIKASWDKVRSFAPPEALNLELIEGGSFQQVSPALVEVLPEEIVDIVNQEGGQIVLRRHFIDLIISRLSIGRDRAERLLTRAVSEGFVISEPDPDNGSRRIYRLPDESPDSA